MGGARIDYLLKAPPTAPVRLEFLDGAGKLIRSYASAALDTSTLKTALDSLARRTRDRQRDSVTFPPADSVVQARAGANRFVWDLRYPGAKQLKNTVIDEGTLDGPIAPPGEYRVRLIVGADTMTRSLAIVADPRVTTSTADLVTQFEAALRVRDRISDVAEASLRVEDVQTQIDARKDGTKDQPYARQVADAAAPVRAKLESVRADLYEIGCHVDQCTLDMPIKLYNMLITLNMQVQTGDYAPTRQHGEVYDELAGKVAGQLTRLQSIIDTDLAGLNKVLTALNVPPIFVAPKLKIAM